jgi:pimeloyl-ACP methyl ester carboxylesterase
MTFVATPTLVIDGEESPLVMRSAARAVAEALPNGRRRTLGGQTHDISLDATAAALEAFLSR